MGCEYCPNQVHKSMGENINIKGDKEIDYKSNNDNENKNINQNMFFQNPKEDNTKKIKNPVKMDSNNNNSNKLKK